MKYIVWFLRLLFASWMIPAGLNHFVPLFPQPMGTAPLSMELIVALLDSHLFDLVKAVELIAGIGVLFGFYTPLALLICLPVSFGVFYWDAPLEGWGSGAARFGYATLLCNALLCVAYYKHYLSMFSLRAEVGGERKQLVMIGRLVLGALVLLYAANALVLSPPTGSGGLAEQLMTSLANSRLLHVALVVQVAAGVLLLAGILVPLALTAQMMISSNALFWSLFLDQSPLGILLTGVIFAINGLLMLAYLPYYKDILARYSTASVEETGPASYDGLFVSHAGNTAKTHYLPAVITVLATILFYPYFVTNWSVDYYPLVLLYPLFTLLIRRFRDMGRHPWLVAIPLSLMLLVFDIGLNLFSFSESVDGPFTWLALIVTAGFLVWGGIGDSEMPAAVSEKT